MKIVYQQCPAMMEYQLFSDFPFQQVKEAKTVTFDISNEGKTRLYIAMQYDKSRASANYMPAGSACFKFDLKKHANMVHGKVVTQALFKLTSKQGLPQLEQHLKNIVCDVFKLTETDEFTINVWCTRTIQALQATQPAVSTKVQEVVQG